MRFIVVVGLLMFTAHRLPAPVVEGPPPFKRTFFTLKGHAVDTFANEKKLPPELAPAFNRASVLATKPLIELTDLMGKFGHAGGVGPTVLSAGADGEEQTPEMQRREAAIQKIAKSQLKKIATTPILPMAAGLASDIQFSASELPAAFFTDNAWDLEIAHPEGLLTEGVKRPSRTRLDIPLSGVIQLFRYATKKDIEIMRRASENPKIKNDRGSALLRFYSEACRSGAPQRLLPMRVISGGCGDGGALVIAEPPPLQVRVVVLENIQNTAIEFGQFHFRMLDPGRGILSVRTRAENETLLATMNADSQVWYKPRVVKPGEKVIVPLELLFKPSRSPYSNREAEPAATRTGRRACANQLLADRDLQTVALMGESYDAGASHPVPVVVMPKQKFVDALLREPAVAPANEAFVYGPSIALDSVDVNGFRSEIEPFDPINVAYYSSFEEGSCPFVYSRHTSEGPWLKQGTILRGRSSKAREGTGVLKVRAFDGTLRIAEEEEEISYIDELFVHGRLANGESVTLRPADDLIAHKDFRYLVLKKGESVEIKFSVPNGMRGDSVEVVGSGFFELSPVPVAQ